MTIDRNDETIVRTYIGSTRPNTSLEINTYWSCSKCRTSKLLGDLFFGGETMGSILRDDFVKKIRGSLPEHAICCLECKEPINLGLIPNVVRYGGQDILRKFTDDEEGFWFHLDEITWKRVEPGHNIIETQWGVFEILDGGASVKMIDGPSAKFED